MGTLVVIIALVVEAAFATYCIATKANHEQARSYLRLGALAVFVILTLVSVFQWGFRWYGLAALLLIWAALGAWTLLRKRVEHGQYQAWRIVLRALGAAVLVFIVVTPALILPQHRSPKVTGRYTVVTASYTYTDVSRVETFTNTGEHREVNVEFWYPEVTSGRYPLVVFSHGAFGMKSGNASTFMELASNGYVVCSIDHPYHALYTKDAGGKVTIIDRSYMQEVQDSNSGKYDDEEELALYQKWMQLRTADISFVLDTIVERAGDAGAGKVYQLVDTEKIGLIGHSMGGAASVQVGRDRQDIDAVINLDGDMLGEYRDVVDGRPVIDEAAYPVPILSIYTDDMEQLFARITDPNYTVPGKHVTATSPHGYEIYTPGTNHMSLTDVPIVMPLLVTLIGNPKGLVHTTQADPYEVIETMNATVLQFFDAYLKGQGSFTPNGDAANG